MAFLQCPAQADARFQGVYSPASRTSFVGNLAHQVFRRHLTQGQIPDDDFDRICREEIGNSSRLNNTMGELRIKPSALGGVFEEVRALYQRFTSFPQEGFAGAEIMFDLTPADGVQLVGQIDAVFEESFGGHRLVDWKTGELGEPARQLMFYALLWMLDRQILPARLEAISVRTGERFSSTPGLDDIAKVAASVGAMIDEMRSNWASGKEFERNGGPWCRYCPVLTECPEGAATLSVLDGSPPA